MAKSKKSLKKIPRGQLPFGVCVVAVAPVRRQPSDTAEMVTQLLFGETLKVIVKKHNSWMKIKCRHDGYVGWIDSKQVVRVTEEECLSYEKDPIYSMDLAGMISSSKEAFPILLGSRLPLFDGMHLYAHDEKYLYNGAVVSPDPQQVIEEEYFERIVKKFIHAPYLWGGRSIFGIDCSGFTQVVFSLLGTQLPRDAYQQVDCGEVIDFVNMSSPGDLAFFENENGKITHVGILLRDGKIIHASGQVRIDSIDQEGIYDKEKRKYTHKFRVAKRILSLRLNSEK
jgi:hypothetical protein